MLNKTLLACVLLGLCGAASSLRCRWINHKFTQYSRTSLSLLEAMANNSTNTTEEDTVTFPKELFSQASEAPAGDRLSFVVQLLEEVSELFQEDHSSAPWEKTTVDDFLNIVNQQADGLRPCTQSHKNNKKLQMFFQRLSRHVLVAKGRSADAWELIRKGVKLLLFRAQRLIASPAP
ncbi:interferon phi 4 [Aulostomus maculatus]